MFSGDPPTAIINTREAETAADRGIKGKAEEQKVTLMADTCGKGDHQNSLVGSELEGLMCARAVEKVGVEFWPAKVLIAKGIGEAERALLNWESGYSHGVARPAGAMPVAEPQGSDTLPCDSIIACATDLASAIQRYEACPEAAER